MIYIFRKQNLKKLFLLPVVALFLTGCKAFMHGYTWNKAQNSYYLVTGADDNFGDRRIEYNKGFHRNSDLTNFLDCKCNDRGSPDFIYEYKSKAKCRGIKLYYVKLDSVFVFEEPRKGNLNSIWREECNLPDEAKLT